MEEGKWQEKRERKERKQEEGKGKKKKRRNVVSKDFKLHYKH